MTEPTGQARPTGITILAILAGIAGVVSLLGGITLVAFGSVAGGQQSGMLGGFLVILGALLLVSAVLQLAFAWGAWTLRPWAWMLGIVGAAMGLGINVLQLVDGRGGAASPLITVLLYGGILYYLFTPAIRAAFGRS